MEIDHFLTLLLPQHHLPFSHWGRMREIEDPSAPRHLIHHHFPNQSSLFKHTHHPLISSSSVSDSPPFPFLSTLSPSLSQSLVFPSPTNFFVNSSHILISGFLNLSIFLKLLPLLHWSCLQTWLCLIPKYLFKVPKIIGLWPLFSFSSTESVLSSWSVSESIHYSVFTFFNIL
jgi:hypothetical protein